MVRRLLVVWFVVSVAIVGCSSSSGFGEDGNGGPKTTDDSGILPPDEDDQDAEQPPDIIDERDATVDTGPNDSSLSNDAKLDVAPDGCVPGAVDAGPPPFAQRCAPATANECSGATDGWLGTAGIGAALQNGTGGNGFDDDCDGKVDEGCGCPGNGQTRDCYLVPATQADPATKKPVGWCTDNSKGSLDCAGVEFPKWSGVCRGAQPPYADDACANGDFNCDGLQQNSKTQDCKCKSDPVTCPTAPIIRAPYPTPTQIQLIDGSLWVDPSLRAQTTGWTWTVVGGDCDNVLPWPTFAIYGQTNSTAAGARRGARQAVAFDTSANPARYVLSAGAPLASIRAPAYGDGVVGGQVYPAFGLSGDYVVQGEFDLQGKHYVCTQKVQVRAPGVRAELCWDSVGGSGAGGGGTDIDLHLARLQGTTCTGNHGWDTMCTGQKEDCYYSSSSGCPSGGDPAWGYATSADASCKGWSSKRSALTTCTNPRLDKDNISCDRTDTDPTSFNFCGPENINLDNPKNGDRFVIGVNHFLPHGVTNAKPHVNVYCNGARVLSVGYNPVTGQTAFPLLTVGGSDSTGDYWNVATVKSNVTGAQLTSCDVETVPSRNPDPTRDGPGGTQLCVDSVENHTPAPNLFSYTNHRWIERAGVQGAAVGAVPTLAPQFCKH